MFYNNEFNGNWLMLLKDRKLKLTFSKVTGSRRVLGSRKCTGINMTGRPRQVLGQSNIF